MEKTQVVDPAEVRRRARAVLSRDDVHRLLDADIIASGVLDEHPARPTVWLVIGVSATIDRNDVERVLQWSELLRRVVPDVIPVVLGETVTEGGSSAASEQRVVLVRNGNIMGWTEAGERWVTRSPSESTNVSCLTEGGRDD